MSIVSESTEPHFTSRDELLSTFDGDTEFVRELVLTFLDRVPVLLGAIESGLNAGDRAAVSHAAHDLKGVLGYFDQELNLPVVLRIERIASANLAEGSALLQHLHEGLGTLKSYLAEQFVTGRNCSATGLGPAN